MSQELKFANTNEAIQYLSNITNAKIIVARLQPDKDDYVIFLNPRNNYYNILKFPGSNIREFSKQDIVKDLRAKGNKGSDLVFPESMEPHQVAKEVADMVAGLSTDDRHKLKAEDMRGIYMADSLVSDRSKDIGDIGAIDFVTDRGYHGIGSIGVLKSKEDISKEKERRLKQIKKAPRRYKEKIQKEEFDPYSPAKMHDVSRQQLQKVFSSSDEAIQYLADTIGKRVVISQ